MFWITDFIPLLAALLLAITSAVTGSLLLLRRQALMVDAISHSVLPGIVLAFLITSTITTPVLIMGGVTIALFAAWLIGWVEKKTMLDATSSMGVVFSCLFALGLVMIGILDLGNMHLEPSHVLFGQLETLIWPVPGDITTLPPDIWGLAVILFLVLIWMLWGGNGLKAFLFDGGFARVRGLPAQIFHYGILMITAWVVVVGFRAVGSILVIAMMAAPPMAARLVTNTYQGQFIWAVIFAITATLTGYGLAILWDLSIGGMIAVMGGGQVLFCWLKSLCHDRKSRHQRQP